MPADSNRESVQGAQSVDRALSILGAFTPERPRQRISDLVTKTGLGQSTVSRIVAAMTGAGFIQPDSYSGLYGLGPELVTLAALVLNEDPVHSAGRQIAQNLAARLGLGVNLAVRHGDRLFYLCDFEGKDAPRNSTLIGRGGPLHATALGKALLLDLDDVQLEALVGNQLDRYTPRTITTLPGLREALDSVASRGYAVEDEEVALRRACIAVPIRGREGDVIAALSISGPLSAINLAEREEALAMVLIEEADQISTALGHVARAAV